MYKQRFGKGKQMRFVNESEFYETLGFLAKSDGSIDLRVENNQNQGAWAHEGRIYCYSNLGKFTKPLKDKFTEGRGKKILRRINCTEFVLGIVAIHKFVENSLIQNSKEIRSTIPAKFLADFDHGFGL
jgi:hypothetical protein